MSKKRKHHYLPQFYIGSFANKQGEVFVFEHKTGNINKQSKNGTFHLPYFYTMDLSKHKKRDPEEVLKIRKSLGLENVDTSKVKEYPDMVEDLLGDSENSGARIIRKLISGEQISLMERAELSMFIALMYTRNPAFHDFVSKMEQKMMEQEIKKIFSSEEQVGAIYNELPEDSQDRNVSVDDLFKLVEERRFEIEIPKELNIQNMLMVAPMIDTILQNKTWLILEAPLGVSFITNDNPVFLEHPYPHKIDPLNIGFEAPGVKIFFPLSQECLLVMFSTPDGGIIVRKKIDEEGVQKFNQKIFANSNSHIIAHDAGLINRLKK